MAAHLDSPDFQLAAPLDAKEAVRDADSRAGLGGHKDNPAIDALDGHWQARGGGNLLGKLLIVGCPESGSSTALPCTSR